MGQDLGLLGEGVRIPVESRVNRWSPCLMAAPRPARLAAAVVAVVAAVRVVVVVTGGGPPAGGAGGGPGVDDEDGTAGRRGGAPRGPGHTQPSISVDANNPLYRTVDGEMPKRPIGGKKKGGGRARRMSRGHRHRDIPCVATLLRRSAQRHRNCRNIPDWAVRKAAPNKIRAASFVIGMLKRDERCKSFEMANRGLSI
jgi:hypothetical protein